MRYLDVCAGISASTVAWKPLGWQAAAYSEIEAAPRAILAHHYPEVPLHGDFTTIESGQYGSIDLLVGGTPCQDFSIAGLRAGISGDRGNLTLEYLRLADRTRPRWLVWENVPGVLSADGGRALGAFLGGLAQLGYGFAYRVLDAQYYGVAQRRRRVFVVGHIGGQWRRAGAVLFERASLRGDPPPRRRSAQDVAGAIAASSFSGGAGGRPDGAAAGHFIADGPAKALLASTGQRFDPETDNLLAVPVYALQERLGAAGDTAGPQGKGWSDDGVSFTLEARNKVQSVAIPISQDAMRGEGRALTPSPDAEGRVRLRDPGFGVGEDGDPAATITAAAPGGVAHGAAVRRLTPRECERLQGFPDDYTLTPYRGREMADGPRYKALGNSMAVPVMRWIGERIAAVDALAVEERAS